MKARLVIDTIIDVDIADPDWVDYRDAVWCYFCEHIDDYALSKDVSYDVIGEDEPLYNLS